MNRDNQTMLTAILILSAFNAAALLTIGLRTRHMLGQMTVLMAKFMREWPEIERVDGWKIKE